MNDAPPVRELAADRANRSWSGVIAALFLAITLAGCASASSPGQQQPLPLAASTASANGAWVVAHVGAPSGEESFWELLRQAPHGTHWKLITPAGVQDSGGLTLATTPASVVAGFIISNNLRFSPLATSRNEGRVWRPSVLPAGLLPGPDSVAVTSEGTILALLAGSHGEVQRLSIAGSQSSLVVSAAMLAHSAPGCTLLAITGLTLTPREQPIVGGPCRQPGAVGIYTYKAGRWRRAAPSLPPNVQRDHVQLLRLTRASPAALLALIVTHAPTQQAVIAAWSDDGGTRWSESQPLKLEDGERLFSTGVGPGRQTVVLTESRRGDGLWISGGPSSPWRSLPTPPAGTTTVVLHSDGDIEAFQAEKTTLVAWQLELTHPRWSPGGTIHVPF
jgi:hypothetical protein